jgi:hemerythrin
MTYAYTTWSRDLETGHPLIDDQHQRLIAAVNALFDAHRNGKGRTEVERTMNFLVDYTFKHFSEEEKLQEKHKYPDYPRHKQIHAEFKETAARMADALHLNGPTDEYITHVYTTIGRWVINHIKSEDFKLVAHIRKTEREA